MMAGCGCGKPKLAAPGNVVAQQTVHKSTAGMAPVAAAQTYQSSTMRSAPQAPVLQRTTV